MNSVTKKIWARIRGKGRGWVFTPKHFLDLGSRAAVDQALCRLHGQDRIRRFGRGIYDSPKLHPVLGALSPSPDSIARALTIGADLQVTPSQAANLLGLTSQVPAKLVYLTNANSRRVKIGSQVIYLKHAGPQMLGAGKLGGLALQALRYFGRDGISDDVIQHMAQILPPPVKTDLKRLAARAPQWTHSVIGKIAV